MSASHFEWRGQTLRLKCKLQPNASANKFAGVANQELKILLTSPPVDGKANAQLVKFLGKAFGVPKSAVNIVAGELNRHKTVEICAPKKLPPECLLNTQHCQDEK